MAPDKSILGVISKEDRNAEIQRRLQDQETTKARQLLALAFTHLDAMKMTKSQIEKQLIGFNESNGHSGSNRK
jgi:hypothetical protein